MARVAPSEPGSARAGARLARRRRGADVDGLAPPCGAARPYACQTAQQRKDPALSNYLLKLFVTGKTPRAEQAIANLRRICAEELDGRYELQIVDVLEHPEQAEEEKILATPTLIKRLPPPLRRVIGDLSDREKVLVGLDVRPAHPPLQGKAE